MCKESGWDYNEEIPTGFVVPDQGSIGFGTSINPDPPNANVARMRIFLDIIHDEPFTLDIMMVHHHYPDTIPPPETLVIWDNDYPGDIQETDLEYFVGWLVEGRWGISIIDELEDSNSGLCNEFILMIEYQ
ncbi:MAG: hypothetical protein WBB67_04360 [bacterium]